MKWSFQAFETLYKMNNKRCHWCPSTLMSISDPAARTFSLLVPDLCLWTVCSQRRAKSSLKIFLLMLFSTNRKIFRFTPDKPDKNIVSMEEDCGWLKKSTWFCLMSRVLSFLMFWPTVTLRRSLSRIMIFLNRDDNWIGAIMEVGTLVLVSFSKNLTYFCMIIMQNALCLSYGL